MVGFSNVEPSVFDSKSVTSDTQQAMERLAELLSDQPAVHEVDPVVTRNERAEGRSFVGPITKLENAKIRSVPAPSGEVPIRIFIPDKVEGIYLHIHGGGWVLGRADQQDESLWSTACHANLAVVSVDYRLAPENPYPAGPDDCEAVALWLAERSQQEFGSDRIAIGGESAGGHLSAVTLLRMRDRHGFKGFIAANLVYGIFDVSLTPSQRAASDAVILPTATTAWFASHFVPDESMRRDPDVSPLYANLSDMPPALFTIGTDDPLLDDTLFMHQRWVAAGNAAELAVYPGVGHAFNRLPIDVARDADRRANTFLARALYE